MVLVATWVAEVYVGTDETLLVAQQDHNLCQKKRGSRYVRSGTQTLYVHIEYKHNHNRTCSQDMLRW